jgi:dipeptidyl aminopeptidase/acylaminoacyl peptidase
MICSVLALVNVASASFAPTVQNEKRPVTYEDLKHVTDPYEPFALSGDGRTIAFVQNGNIFLKKTSDATATVKIGAGSFPKWSPDGSRLAYYSSGTGTLQLWVYTLRGRTAQAVTSLPTGINPDPRLWLVSWGGGPGTHRYDWSPDGTRLVFVSRVPQNGQSHSGSEGLVPPSYLPLFLDGSTDPDATISGIFRKKPDESLAADSSTSRSGDTTATLVQQLFVVDLKEHPAKVTQLTKGSAGYFQPAWSPDGSSIACATTEGKSLDGTIETGDIVRVDALTGERLGATLGRGLKYLPSWSADGKHIVFLENETDGVYGFPTLYAWDWRRGNTSALIPRLNSRVRYYEVDLKRNEVIFLYRDGLRSLLDRVGFDGRPPRLIRAEGYDRMPIEFTVDKMGDIAWSLTTSDNPGLIELLSGKPQNPKVIVDLNPDSAHWLLGRRREVHWTNARGDQQDGIVIEPPGFDPKKPYPTIVDAYPLIRGAAWGLLAGNRAWASRGYLIFVPAARGPHVWANDWSTRRYGLVARGRDGWEVTQDDLMSGVNALTAQGLIDRNRICIYGHSNGGAVALNVIARTNAFACAVAVAPVVLDWLSSSTIETVGPAWAKRTVGSSSVFDDPESYLNLSVLYKASAVHTPTLLAVGDYDSPETLLGTIGMYNALRYLGRDVTMLRYRDQGHVFDGAAMKDFWERELDFFDQHLRGGGTSP